jgi:AraC-like DNA-binding protein
MARSTKFDFSALVPPSLPERPALLAPLLANAFDELHISVALWIEGDWWYPIHVVPNVSSFEFEHGVEARRWAYNRRSFAKVRTTRKMVVGSHAGFCDLFIPVGSSSLEGVLVAGPFSTQMPTSHQVHERWRRMASAQGRIQDHDFFQYLSMTLASLLLEGPHLESFQRLMTCFAGLIGGHGSPSALFRQAENWRSKLSDARAAERMWDVARSMVDDRTTRSWDAFSQLRSLSSFGLEQSPEHVIVGLTVGRSDEGDPLDGILRRYSFQKACANIARRSGGTICGRIGDHGVVFLVGQVGSRARGRSRLADIATRANVEARRFGLRLHTAVGHAAEPTRLPTLYRAALGAAEKALSRGVATTLAEVEPESSAQDLGTLRRELANGAEERPHLLSLRFDRYIEAIVAHCGHRLEQAQAHLEAGLERLVEPLLASGALDEKSFRDLRTIAERATMEARTVVALVAPYRRLIVEVESALQNPTAARHDRGIRRALGFIREHLSRPLTLAQVSRVAGFAPGYFSKLFKRVEGITFERHTQQLRIDRAKQMLEGTTLSIERIRQLSGFRTRNYFHRVFKQAEGVTPGRYRQRALR